MLHNYLEPVSIPIDSQVAPYSNFKIVIPIHIKQTCKSTDKTLEESFVFVDSQQVPFGDKIEVQIQIQKEDVSEGQIYQTAMELFEKQGKHGKSIPFEDVV